jgi:hypothetical protein
MAYEFIDLGMALVDTRFYAELEARVNQEWIRMAYR